MGHQPGVLALVPPHRAFSGPGRSPDGDLRAALARLQRWTVADSVVGLGDPLVRALGAHIERLRPFPAISGGFEMCGFHGDDIGHRRLKVA
jgi:porphyrinogen peroxidase